MDEKVLFNNTQPQNQQGGAQPPPPDVSSQLPQQPPAQVVSQDVVAPQPPNSPPETPPLDPSDGDGGFLSDRPLLKKILIGVAVFLLMALLIFVFIPKKQTVKSVKLVWWGLWEENRVMQAAIIDFRKTYPHIDIEYIKQTPKDYRERLVTRIQKGTGPDIFRFHNTWLPMLSDVLLPLSKDVITLDEFRKDYYPVMQDDLVLNGGIYGIPLEGDTLSLYVNTDIFKQANAQVPQTWEDFSEVARDKLTTKGKDGTIRVAGAALGDSGNVTHAPDIISLLMLQQGVGIKKFSEFSKNESDALEFYTSFVLGRDDTKINNTWDSTLDESKLAFSKGNLAMYFGYSWDAFDIQRLNPQLQFKIYAAPQLPGVKKALASYWVEGVSSKSPHQKEAFEFMRYLSKKETLQKLYAEQAKVRGFGEPYARVDLADSLKDNAMVYPFVSQLAYAKSSLFASNTNDGEGGLNSLLNTYLMISVDTLTKDNSSMDTAVEALQKGVGKVYQDYGIQ